MMLQQLFAIGSVVGGGGGGIGTQTNTDNFNRANEDPLSGGGNWVSTTNRIQLISNTVQPLGTSNDREAIYTVWANGNNHYSQMKITSVASSTGNGFGVCVRHDPTVGTKTMYRLVLEGGGNFEVVKLVAGATTSLRTGTVSYVAATALGLSINGSTLKVWYAGVQIGADITDSTITTGVPGIAYSSTVASVPTGDDWDAGTVP
jgi:hypothetical protein